MAAGLFGEEVEGDEGVGDHAEAARVGAGALGEVFGGEGACGRERVEQFALNSRADDQGRGEAPGELHQSFGRGLLRIRLHAKVLSL